MTSNYHYEAELVLGIGGSSSPDLSPSSAADLIKAVGVGCDLTRRDLQNDAKEKRRPWDDSKGVEDSAPIGGLYLAGEGKEREWWWNPRAELKLIHGDSVKQKALVQSMVWSPGEIVATIAKFHDLHAGDIIFTGTPEGVGKVERGERVRVTLDAEGGELECEFVCE